MIPERKLQDYAEITIEANYLTNLGLLFTGFGLQKMSDYYYANDSVSVFMQTVIQNQVGFRRSILGKLGYNFLDTYVRVMSIDQESGKDICDLVREIVDQQKKKWFVIRSLTRWDYT